MVASNMVTTIKPSSNPDVLNPSPDMKNTIYPDIPINVTIESTIQVNDPHSEINSNNSFSVLLKLNLEDL